MWQEAELSLDELISPSAQIRTDSGGKFLAYLLLARAATRGSFKSKLVDLHFVKNTLHCHSLASLPLPSLYLGWCRLGYKGGTMHCQVVGS
jgi:hypothetical protein